MKIKVPTIASADVLVIGGSTDAVAVAINLRERGLSVFMAVQQSYFGDDVCATLDLQGNAARAAWRLIGAKGPVTPLEIKRRLDRLVIDSGVNFLFQMHPVRPMLHAGGRVCGVLFADRSGFQSVSAKVVVDATHYLTFARMAGVPMKRFVPGLYPVSIFTVGGVSDDPRLRVDKMPLPVMDGPEHFYPLFRSEMDIDFTEDTMFSRANACNVLRRVVWHGDVTAMSDRPIIDLRDGVVEGYSASARLPVVACEQGRALNAIEEAAELAVALPMPEPATFAGKSLWHGNSEVVRKDNFVRFGDCPVLEFDLNSIPEKCNTEIFVAGGGTGGAPAAIAAARSGAKVICAEISGCLGGLTTAGRISNYCFGNRTGFTAELDIGVHDQAADAGWELGSTYVKSEWKAHWLLSQAMTSGCEVLFNTTCVASVVSDNKICGVVIANDFGCHIIRSRFLVDATGNADVVAAAGVETKFDRTKEPVVQGAGISIVHLDFCYTNADYLFVMDHDIVDATKAFLMSRMKFSGRFDIVKMLNTRERRCIVGDLNLMPYDFFANRTYSDTINIAFSNFDTHGFIMHPMFMLKPTYHEARTAKIPLRALMPRGFEGALVTGLAIAAHRDCMPLVRMQPDVQNHAYAAGLAAAMAVKSTCGIREIDVRQLQRKLILAGHFPSEILAENDKQFSIDDGDEWKEVSMLFIDPEESKKTLKEKLAKNPGDVWTASALAFAGDDSGRELLRKHISATAWDKGWNFTGMGQFGPSMSVLDMNITALSAIGGAGDAVMPRLRELKISDDFSHIRAVAMSFIAEPLKEAAKEFDRILSSPGAAGHSVNSYDEIAQAASVNHENWNDTEHRNSQLKEVYLAKALAACDPKSEIAQRVLSLYATGMDGLYIEFASK